LEVNEMRLVLKAAVPAIAAALLLAACGSSSSSTTTNASGASAATVKTGSSSLGTVLVDSSGMTLYALSAERNGKFICTASACTAIWHPLTVSAGATPGGVSSLSTVKRPDGMTQVTYKGAPLYTFAQDRAPGETKGQGFKDVGTWSAVTVGAAAAPAASTTTETPAGGGSRY